MLDTHSSERQRVNLTVRKSILDEAKQLKLNLSQTAEAALSAEIKKHKEAKWLEENADAIAAYNKRIEQYGTAIKPIWEVRSEEEHGQV